MCPHGVSVHPRRYTMRDHPTSVRSGSKDSLNNDFKFSAEKRQNDDIARVYVAVEDDDARSLAYHTIDLGVMNVDELSRRPRGDPGQGKIPILFLGQIAVDRKFQDLGIGSILMHHVFEKAQAIADEAECHAVFLDALSDGGKDALERRQACYNSFGFQGFASSSARLFMTMKQVRAIVETATGGQDISTERVSTPAPPVNSFVFLLASIHLAQFMNRRHRDRNSPDSPWRSDRWITRVSGSGLSCR